MNQKDLYKQKLVYEIDSDDLFNKLQKEKHNIIVVDVRSSEAYNREHIP